MKRLYSILMLALCTLLGATSVQAQHATTYNIGDQIFDAAEAVGQDVVIRNYKFQTYWAGVYQSTSITEDALWSIIPTGETVDGYATYYLQQKTTGIYLADYDLGAMDDTGDAGLDVVPTTEDVNLAMKFTIEQGQSDDESNYRTYALTASGHNNIPGMGGFVIMRDKPTQNGRYMSFMAYYSNLAYSVYTDTNLNDIFTVSEAEGYSTLMAYIQEYFPNGVSESLYSIGTNPGQTPQSLYDEAVEIYNEANQMLMDDKASDAEFREMADKVKEMAERLVSESVPMQEGCYFIHDSRAEQRWPYAGDYGTMNLTANYSVPEIIDAEAARYVWKITAGVADGTWHIQSWALKTYANSELNGRAFTLSEVPSDWKIEKAAWGAAASWSEGTIPTGTFNIYAASDQSLQWNCFREGYIGQWADLKDVGNCFQFITINEKELEGLEDLVAQQALNNTLKALYDTAKNVRSQNLAYTSSATRDAFFDDMGLVTDAACLYSNELETSEGSYEGLIDGDFTTYFHTSWKEQQDPDGGLHFIQADLGQAVEALQIKYAQRIGQLNNCEPTLMNVWATNDPDGEWVSQGQVVMKYDIDWVTTDADGGELTYKNFLGVAGFGFDAPYRYVRLECVDRIIGTSSQLMNGQPLWYLSELHFYEAQFDQAASNYYVVSEASRAEFESALEEAKTALEDESATQQIIDRLQAAYDDVISQLPSTDALVAAIAAAKSE